MSKSADLWQRSLLALCLLALFAVAESAWATYYLEGDAVGGEPFGPVTIAPFLDRFDSIVPGSLVSRSGIRTGDALDLARMTPEARYGWRNEVLAAKPIRLAIVRDGTLHWTTVTPEPYTEIPFFASSQVFFNWAFWIGSAVGICVAALLIRRRPDSAEVRMLALTLILIELGENLFPINGWLTPWPRIDMVINIAAQFIFSGGVALLAGYASLFGRPVSLARRVLTALTYAIAALSALLWTAAPQGGFGPGGVLGIAGLWLGTVDVHAWILQRPALLFAAVVGPSAMALLCAVLAVRSARGDERPRVAWAAGSLAILYLFGIATIQGYVTSNVLVYYWILNISWFVAPVGLTYALLSRRLLDVGFVLNRAAVFTGVSILVVGLFTLIEWALGGWLHGAGRVTNVTVSAAIALVLGLSLNQIHKRVDLIVDRVLFRKRHEDERALLRFAREVTFITSADVALQRAIETLKVHGDASTVEILLDGGDGHYGSIDENDPALVALRASHEPVDLHLVKTRLAGEFAYPMVARGHLIGALVLGAKTTGEPYAPDESVAIAHLAHGVGVALDLLGTAASHANDRVLDALRSVSEEIRALPDAIAESLRAPHV